MLKIIVKCARNNFDNPEQLMIILVLSIYRTYIFHKNEVGLLPFQISDKIILTARCIKYLLQNNTGMRFTCFLSYYTKNLAFLFFGISHGS